MPINELDRYFLQLAAQPPFSLLPESLRKEWLDGAELCRYKPGQRLLRPDQFPSRVFLLLKGEVRLLVEDVSDKRPITLEKRGPGQLLGWSSLLSAVPFEWVSVSEDALLLALPADGFIDAVCNCKSFAAFFQELAPPQEVYRV
ncbi:MAG: Crp/Fnr family transcriptional regulator, partial [Prochlorococcus sp.]